jgi:hypothetical protein
MAEELPCGELRPVRSRDESSGDRSTLSVLDDVKRKWWSNLLAGETADDLFGSGSRG